jgi:hypothetical protein
MSKAGRFIEERYDSHLLARCSTSVLKTFQMVTMQNIPSCLTDIFPNYFALQRFLFNRVTHLFVFGFLFFLISNHTCLIILGTCMHNFLYCEFQIMACVFNTIELRNIVHLYRMSLLTFVDIKCRSNARGII